MTLANLLNNGAPTAVLALAVFIGGVIYHVRGGGPGAAAETIDLLKEQVGALQAKVESLVTQQDATEHEMTLLRERNAQLTELVTSAGAIERLINTVAEDRILQREERHRILNSMNALTGMTQLLFEREFGPLSDKLPEGK